MKDVKNRMTNPRDFRLDPNYVAPDQEKQKLLIKLAGMITDRYVAKYTHTIAPDDPEVWCLDEVLTKNEVKFMLSFKKTRTNYDLEKLAEMKIQRRCWIIFAGSAVLKPIVRIRIITSSMMYRSLYLVLLNS